jgi:hypothetical protein
VTSPLEQISNINTTYLYYLGAQAPLSPEKLSFRRGTLSVTVIFTPPRACMWVRLHRSGSGLKFGLHIY